MIGMFGNTAMKMSGLHMVFLSLWMWLGIVIIILVHDKTKPMWCNSKYQRSGGIKPQQFVHLIWCYPCLEGSDLSNCFCTPPFIISHFCSFVFHYTQHSNCSATLCYLSPSTVHTNVPGLFPAMHLPQNTHIRMLISWTQYTSQQVQFCTPAAVNSNFCDLSDTVLCV